jgi:hypothetical protein
MAGERVTTARLVRESIAEQVYAIIKEERISSSS